MVGAVVITIVVTAGMVSTTWVQFLKGSLLVIFSTVLVVMLLRGGLQTDTTAFQIIGPLSSESLGAAPIDGRDVIPATDGWQENGLKLQVLAEGAGNPSGIYRRQSMKARVQGI